MFVQYHLSRSRSSNQQSQQQQHHLRQPNSSSPREQDLRKSHGSSSWQCGLKSSPVVGSRQQQQQQQQQQQHRRANSGDHLAAQRSRLVFDFGELALSKQGGAGRAQCTPGERKSVKQEEWVAKSTGWLARARKIVSHLGLHSYLEPSSKIQLITEFCLSFLVYQLETLFLLAANAQLALESCSWSAGDQEAARSELQARRLSKRRQSLLELHLQPRLACCSLGCDSPEAMLPGHSARKPSPIQTQRSLAATSPACVNQTHQERPNRLRQRSQTTSSAFPVEQAARCNLLGLARCARQEPARAPVSQLMLIKRHESAQVRERFRLNPSGRPASSSSPVERQPEPASRSTPAGPAKGAPGELRQEISTSASLPSSLQAARKKAAAASSTKLSLSGAKRRFGFKQRGLSSISVQRSEEVLSIDAYRYLSRQSTVNSTLSDSVGGGGGLSDGSSAVITQSSLCCAPKDPRQPFVEGLGAGQIASRQVLVSPSFGDIQLSLSDRRGVLEIEVIRARSLLPKAGVQRLPAPYVKLYLMHNRKCIGKFKTTRSKPTLDPLFQEQFTFRQDYHNSVLQVIVWADYGKRDHKSLMGVAQIQLASLDISSLIVSWYRLFNAPSMACSSHVSSKALRHTI